MQEKVCTENLKIVQEILTEVNEINKPHLHHTARLWFLQSLINQLMLFEIKMLIAILDFLMAKFYSVLPVTPKIDP